MIGSMIAVESFYSSSASSKNKMFSIGVTSWDATWLFTIPLLKTIWTSLL